MPRGGKRLCAGRKRKLTLPQRAAIGRQCEAMARSLHERAVAELEARWMGPDLAAATKALPAARERGDTAEIERLENIIAREQKCLTLPFNEYRRRSGQPLWGRAQIAKEVSKQRSVALREVWRCWAQERRRLKAVGCACTGRYV